MRRGRGMKRGKGMGSSNVLVQQQAPLGQGCAAIASTLQALVKIEGELLFAKRMLGFIHQLPRY